MGIVSEVSILPVLEQEGVPDEGRGEVAEQRACRQALVRDAAALVSVVSMVSVGSMVRVVHGECSKYG